MALVSLAQVNLALRLDLETEGSPAEFIDERTPDIELKIAQAEEIILGYLKAEPDAWTAEDVPASVTASIIMAVRGLLDGPDDILAGLKENDPKNPIVGMLWRLRDPSMA